MEQRSGAHRSGPGSYAHWWQSFVYVATPADQGTVAKQRAITLGDTIGNEYAVTGGLKPGEKVITSGIQFLIDGAPVQPIS